MIDLLIVGTGRCGTKFMAEWLTRSGVPCGHEAVFSYRGYTPQPGLVADSSWLAVPYLPLVACRIVHIVRNPLHVVRSFLGTRHFGPFHVKHKDRRWYQYMALHFGYTDEAPVQQAMKYWIRWNEAIEGFADPEWRFQVETLRRRDMGKIASIAVLWWHEVEVTERPAPTTNAHKRRVALDRLPRTGYFDELAAMAERYGYDPHGL